MTAWESVALESRNATWPVKLFQVAPKVVFPKLEAPGHWGVRVGFGVKVLGGVKVLVGDGVMVGDQVGVAEPVTVHVGEIVEVFVGVAEPVGLEVGVGVGGGGEAQTSDVYDVPS